MKETKDQRLETRDRKAIAEQRRYLREHNAEYLSWHFSPVHPKFWPETPVPLFQVFRSREFLVQIYAEANGMLRLSINRSEITIGGDWKDGITWDDLQRIKSCLGFGNRDAVEVYPPDGDVVNVANIRHLWVFPLGQYTSWFWRGGKPSGSKSGLVAKQLIATP